MAPPSPRRSSRARGNTITQSQNSASTTSSVSGRGERNTRSLHKTASSKSTPTASLSSEPLDDLEDTVLTRRRTRGQEDIRDKVIRVDPYEMTHADDELQEDDESVRCVCGSEEYPGPPPFEEDTKHGKQNPEADFFASIELSEEVSGLFVQCDVCKVWQHGACVGIFTEESSPDEYFCEKCRKDLHKIHTAINGQRYSNYLPLGRASRTTSRATSITKEGTQSPKETTGKNGRASSANQANKRRSTMNSRDAAYDEDEQLRRAIEASKEDAPLEQGELGSRRPKRGRSDSEENQFSLKRQRTSSSASPPPGESAAIEDNSEDEEANRNGLSAKKSRSARAYREKSEREERERQRAESANKRKGRADRRQAEGMQQQNGVPKKPFDTDLEADSDPSEELPLAASRAAAKANTEPPQPTPSTGVDAVIHDDPTPTATIPSAPPTPALPPTIATDPSPAPTPDPTLAAPSHPGSTHKKSSRHHKRGKGRNQYTKDREDTEGSPARSMSRDTARHTDDHNGGSSKNSGTEHGKHISKSKGYSTNKTSMSDMKRRVAAFLDFISKTQIEMAGESTSSSRGSQNSSEHPSPREPIAVSVPGEQTNGGGGALEPTESSPKEDAPNGHSMDDNPKEHEFKDLNCVEMMDVLTRDLVKWQKQYAA